MKKIIIVLLVCFILTGCNNKISFDFNNNIDTKIELFFSESDYKNYSRTKNTNLDEEFDAIISEARPLDNSYDELFKENYFKKTGSNYKGEFEYTYTYSNFKDNSILKRCFEYYVIEEDDNKIYVYLKGDSKCSTFDLSIKAKGRMLNNNANNRKSGVYTWNVNEKNNDIYFNISKNKTSKKYSLASDVLYIVIFIVLLIVIYLYKKKKKYSNYY